MHILNQLLVTSIIFGLIPYSIVCRRKDVAEFSNGIAEHTQVSVLRANNVEA